MGQKGRVVVPFAKRIGRYFISPPLRSRSSDPPEVRALRRGRPKHSSAIRAGCVPD